VLLVLASFGVVGQAVGATGDITYDGCISNDGSGGSCGSAPGSPLTGPKGVAVSPDGKSVYVASGAAGTITHFFAAPGGQLSYDGCISNDGSGGKCADAPGSPLEDANAVAVSPDGKSVYVTSSGSGTITHFFAAPGGQLSYDGCVSDDGSGGSCASAGGSSLSAADGVAVSPDGRSVYVAGGNDVVHFFAAPGGQLTYDGCISNDGSGGTCAAAPGSPIAGADGVAVSPNGRSVYVTSAGSDTVSHFFAAPGGQLTYDGCISNGGSGGACANAPGDPLEFASSVAVSPDGKSVYVTSATPGAVTHFFAAAGGQLTYDGCISDDGSGGACVNAPGSPLQQAGGVAVSPDGNSVYVAGANTLSSFAAATSSGGQLTYSACVSDDGSDGACVAAPGNPLKGIDDIAVSPNGTAVYATAYDSNDVVHFFRGGENSGGGGTPGGGSSGGSGGSTGGTGATAPLLTSLMITPGAFSAAPSGPSVITLPSSRKGGKVTYQLNVAATVSFVIQQSLPGRRQQITGKTRCVAQTHKNAHAGSCVRVVTLGSFTQTGTAGANTLRFSGRTNAGRLPVGHYTLVATPSATGLPVTVRFRIKPA
jgi:DNA-binding beta-propeller fold protein YncE